MHKRVNVHGSFLAAELIAVEILLPLGASPHHHPLQWGKDTKDSHGVQLVVFKAASKLAEQTLRLLTVSSSKVTKYLSITPQCVGYFWKYV